MEGGGGVTEGSDRSFMGPGVNPGHYEVMANFIVHRTVAVVMELCTNTMKKAVTNVQGLLVRGLVPLFYGLFGAMHLLLVSCLNTKYLILIINFSRI